MTQSPINGLHHVTAVSGPAQQNLDFWSKVLGQRFVKRTVNFDDPGTYHLYYGNRRGEPGTIMTFFPWAGVPRGRPGTGETALTQFAVPPGSLAFWEERLGRSTGRVTGRDTAFGETRLLAEDPDGLAFALVEVADDPRAPWTTADIDAAHAIRGFRGVTLRVNEARRLAALLTGIMGYVEGPRDGRVQRFTAALGSPAGVVDVAEDPDGPEARFGAGRVHHVAFSVKDRAAQEEVRRWLLQAGAHVTPVVDRNYFESIYFRAPGGVLFEVATDEPGFAVDEPEATLGSALKLPAQHEHLRAQLERSLPALAV